jgi:cytochrome c-type biogenesis protein CcmH/NrfG
MPASETGYPKVTVQHKVVVVVALVVVPYVQMDNVQQLRSTNQEI